MEKKTSQIQRRLGILFRDCHGSLCRKNILIFVPSEHHQNFLKSEQFQEDTPYTREMRDDRTTRSVTLVADSQKRQDVIIFFCVFCPRSGNRWIARVDWSSEGLTPRCLTPGDQQKTPFSLSFAAWWKRSHHFAAFHLWKAAALRLWL